MLEKWGIRTRVTGTQAGWQVASGERHGGMRAAMHRAVVYEHSVEGYYDMGVCLAVCCQDKNATIKRNGVSPDMVVRGDGCPPFFERGRR